MKCFSTFIRDFHAYCWANKKIVQFLKVWDNAPIGVRHHNIVCNSCCQALQGMRWKCKNCDDFDLCSICFFNDKHDLQHSFLRFDSVSSKR